MESVNAVFLHGFLGLPQDGEALYKNLNSQKISFQWQAPHLWRDVSPREFTSLPQAGERLSSVIKGERLHIFAYSLGGRVMLHWPQEQWGRIASLTLISVHGGLVSNNERELRAEQDVMWSQRFLQEPWESVCQQWNQQDVFREDLWRPVRLEQDFSREELAQALCGWSLSEQENQISQMQKFPFPVTYWSGERDPKFSKYAPLLQTQLLAAPQWHFNEAKGHGHSLHGSAAQEIVADFHRRHF